MYIVRFTRSDDKPVEEYPYRTEIEAVKHFNLFRNDDSGIYRNIAVVEENSNTVIAILLFDSEGRPTGTFKAGDIVRLKTEFCSEWERHLVFSVSNINEATSRCTITCLNSGMAIPSSEIVGLDMIRQVADGKPLNIDEIAKQ